MKISHHIAEETLVAYGAGTLSEAWSLLVAAHLALCPACRAEAERIESVGGALLEELEPAEVGVDAFAHLMQTIDDMSAEPAPTCVARPVPSLLPEPLKSYVGGDLHALKWRRLGKGAFHIPIKTRDG